MACTELLAVAAGAGCSLHTAVAMVGTSGRGPVAASLSGVAQDVDRGVSLERALERLTRDQPPEVLALGTALLVAAGSGTPAAPALQRLADAERRRSRRAVETGIRRLPVLLLLPLVGCILPAFVVMTLVPVGLSAARSVDASPVPTPATLPEAHHG